MGLDRHGGNAAGVRGRGDNGKMMETPTFLQFAVAGNSFGKGPLHPLFALAAQAGLIAGGISGLVTIDDPIWAVMFLFVCLGVVVGWWIALYGDWQREVERIAAINASDTATPVLSRAFEARTAHESEDSKYDLFLNVKEEAQQLAVQIDDSVTRYNYRMIGAYTLVDHATGAKTQGRATAVVSFNVVSSQYSTLFAETAAREKAARVLVEEIDRDILINLAAANEAKAEVRAAKSE